MVRGSLSVYVLRSGPMLVELQIENLALIREARVSFDARMNVLTGETGAGKTLVLKALDLIRGARVDPYDWAMGIPP